MVELRSRVRRLLRRVLDVFPWTPLGLVLGAVAGFSLSEYAFGRLDLVMLVLGYGALGMLALSTLFVLVGVTAMSVVLRRRKREAVADSREEARSEALRMETGRPLALGFGVPALFWLPLVRVRWTWESPANVDVRLREGWRRVEEEVVLRRRGTISRVRRRMIVEDVFGLVRLGFPVDFPLRRAVLPHLGGLRAMPPLTAFAGGEDHPHPMGVEDGDLVELRRYAPGDPARLIHWKVFSRTRTLMVRMPERALTRAQRTVAYLIAGEDDEATAAAARVALESRALGEDWLFAADGSGAMGRTDEALAAIIASAHHRDQAGAGFEAFLRRAEREGPAATLLFVPPHRGPWLERVQKAVTARRERMRVVIGVDALRDRTPRPLWRRLLMRAPQPEGIDVAALDEVVAAFAALRVPVSVVERTSGKLLGEAHRAALRTPKREAA